jgi:hypothetical protein
VALLAVLAGGRQKNRETDRDEADNNELVQLIQDAPRQEEKREVA